MSEKIKTSETKTYDAVSNHESLDQRIERYIFELDLPIRMTRSEAEKHFGKFIKKGTLANLDSKGVGPASMEPYSSGKGKVSYDSRDFLRWFLTR